MPDILWSVIAIGLGLLCYLTPSALGPILPIETRKRLGNYYMNMWMRAFKRATIIKRLLGEHDLKRVTVDQEKPAIKVTFSTGVTGDDQEEYFQDPDNRMKRLFGKPFFILHEGIDAVIDLELAEIGYWWHQHTDQERHRLEETKTTEDGPKTNVKLNPYFEIAEKIRAIDLDDVRHLILFGSEPPDSKTMENFTKQRFAKYSGNVGAVEIISVLMGFATGVGGVVTIRYINKNILGNSGSAEPPRVIDMGGYIDPTPLMDILTSGVIT